MSASVCLECPAWGGSDPSKFSGADIAAGRANAIFIESSVTIMADFLTSDK
jgi:hypothetical protein